MEEIEPLFKQAIEEIERVLTTKTVVGDAITFGETTVIPLVSVGFGFGVGTGGGSTPGSKKSKDISSGGTAGGGGIKPVAIIVIDRDGVRLEPIKPGTASALEKVAEGFLASRMDRDEAA